MLATPSPQPADALLARDQTAQRRSAADQDRPWRGRLIRTGAGDTPVFGAIKAAERVLLETQSSKAYLGPEGDMGFVHALIPYVFGADFDRSRVEGNAARPPAAPARAPRGRSGCTRRRQAHHHGHAVGGPTMRRSWQRSALTLKTFRRSTPLPKAPPIWKPCAPRWPTPRRAMSAPPAWLLPQPYRRARYQRTVGSDRLDGAGCRRSAAARSGLSGLGEGMEADAYGLRKVLAAVPEALVAYSCDKNFGLYRDRVGAIPCRDAGDTHALANAMANGATLARASWSMPPDHGAAAVRIIWAMQRRRRSGSTNWRHRLAAWPQLRGRLASAADRPTHVRRRFATRRGCSMLPLSASRSWRCASATASDMAGSGRISIAGLTTDNLETFIEALRDIAG